MRLSFVPCAAAAPPPADFSPPWFSDNFTLPLQCGASPTRVLGVGPFLTEDQFACALQCPLHEPVVERQLQRWSAVQPLSVDLAEESCNFKRMGDSMGHQFLVYILDNVLYTRCCAYDKEEKSFCAMTDDETKFHNYRPEDLQLAHIAELLEVVPIGDVAFTFATGDGPEPLAQAVQSTGALHLSGSDTETFDTLAGGNEYMFHQIHHHEWGADPEHKRKSERNHKPWARRVSKAVFRGSLCGPDAYHEAQILGWPRSRLVEMAVERPDLLAVGCSGGDLDKNGRMPSDWGKNRLTATETARNAALKKAIDRCRAADPKKGKIVNFNLEHGSYKFVLNVAGVVAAWRMVPLLANRAVILQQTLDNQEVPQGWMKPWVHYVPIKRDLSDLFATIEYLQNHDSVAQRIADAGWHLFHTRVRADNFYCHTYRLLRGLSGLMSPVSEDKKRQLLTGKGQFLLRPYQRRPINIRLDIGVFEGYKPGKAFLSLRDRLLNRTTPGTPLDLRARLPTYVAGRDYWNFGWDTGKRPPAGQAEGKATRKAAQKGTRKKR